MNIQFRNTKDEKPRHGSYIVIVNVQDSYGAWSFDNAEVEYSWDDCNGQQICYDPDGFGIPEGYKLYVNMGIDYIPMDDTETSLFWAYQDDILETFKENGL